MPMHWAEVALELAHLFAPDRKCDLQLALVLTRLSRYHPVLLDFLRPTLARKISILSRTGARDTGVALAAELAKGLESWVLCHHNDSKTMGDTAGDDMSIARGKSKFVMNKFSADPFSDCSWVDTLHHECKAQPRRHETTSTNADVLDPDCEGDGVPFSQSSVFKDLVDFYNREGIRAWLDNGPVPHAISNTRMLASRVVDLVVQSIVMDVSARKPTITLLEVGAGTCKFGYHLASCLADKAKENKFEFCVVMMDISEDVISTRSSHPAFENFLSQRRVDFAKISPDAEDMGSSILVGRDSTLNELIENSDICFVCSNYLIDSLRSDLYVRHEMGLQSIVVSKKKRGCGIKDDDCGFTFTPSSNVLSLKSSYQNSHLVMAMERMWEKEQNGIPFLFPVGTVELMRNTMSCMKGMNDTSCTLEAKPTVVVVVSDKSCTSNDYECPTKAPPGFARHGSTGCYSVAVNMEQLGLAIGCDKAFHTAKESNIFETSCFVFSGSGAKGERFSLDQFADAYQDKLARFDGGEWEQLWTGIDERWHRLFRGHVTPSLGLLASLISLSAYDYCFFKTFRWYVPPLLASTENKSVVDEWVEIGRICYRNRYEHTPAGHLRKEPLQHSRWLYCLGAYPSALQELEKLSLRQVGVGRLILRCTQNIKGISSADRSDRKRQKLL